MQSIQSASLKNHTTLHLDVQANRLFEILSVTDLLDYFKTHIYKTSNWMVLGGGSNILFTKNYDGDVLLNKISGRSIIHETDEFITLKVGAGENWHSLVTWTVQQNYSGIENLALIPGTCGAAPIQNIGAYGVEIKDILESVEYLNLETMSIESIESDECEFGYRDSVFKNRLKNKIVITAISIKLKKKNHRLNTDYAPVKQWLLEHDKVSIAQVSDIYDAIVEIRSSKLPDPNEIGNVGSFFKNPVIAQSHFEELSKDYESMPSYKMDTNTVKIPAGWLIEKAGWKGYRNGDAGVYPKQALVLVNYGNASPSEIVELSQRIIQSVFDTFKITLEPEVNII
ncbi:UDP-N-acetylmuramate dehydrogenase [bacterium]|nr:MAG: UDP-N-acetylmuramate dehydrogenase [bacterium]